jgi:general stress protein YciG
MSISVAEAGRKGGLTVLNRRGRAFYSEIGKKGQQAMRKKHPGMAPEWGKRGGRPKKSTLKEIMGQGK